ncbi:tRNA (adenosine(37)-N6)-threonylcarbamoyltransferase complex dimerization subunit type 1 TsaB, partial [Arthrospira platensis SPKY1]|nr:tRNA (adenosine(37)-N6)-threonylcarbamoyltransferase complex dimerization subunit type 1 TsaB [Arthrospira platensis SPKY1]
MALNREGKTIHEIVRNEGSFQHAEKLHPLIQELLVSQNITSKDLDAIAISFGPGSYTGLRIGISAAKGLAYALQIPLITIDTLQILCKSIHVNTGVIIPMMDARRMEV